MLRNAITATAAVALTVAPIAAQAAPSEVARTGSELGETEQLRSGTGWILAAVALALVIWGILELTGDDEPASP